MMIPVQVIACTVAILVAGCGVVETPQLPFADVEVTAPVNAVAATDLVLAFFAASRTVTLPHVTIRWVNSPPTVDGHEVEGLFHSCDDLVVYVPSDNYPLH